MFDVCLINSYLVISFWFLLFAFFYDNVTAIRCIYIYIANIAETYESLEKIEQWTDNDKSQLEEEIRSILEPKEKQLKEEKQKKLETARNQKTKVIIPQSWTATSADVLKRHIREKLSPQDGNDTSKKPEQWGRVQRDRRQRYYDNQNPQRSYTVAWRTARSSDYQSDSRQPRYRQQQEDRRQRPQGRYFLAKGQHTRSRYKN